MLGCRGGDRDDPCADVRLELAQCRSRDLARWTAPTEKAAWVAIASDLNTHPVVGTLGIALGHVVDIRATVISGASLRTKRDSASYLLRVHEVGGRVLNPSPTLSFVLAPGSDARLANGHWALHRMRRGTEARSLDDRAIAELERGYVGTSVRLTVYETGSFGGTPSDMPADVLSRQDTSFHFESHLVVLNQKD
jgi:hypothetical protein